jgi:hypothetical protein
MIIVQSQDLGTIWPKVEHWLAPAVRENQGDENLLDVLIALARGIYLLWYEEGQFAGVVQVSHYPRQKVATVLYCGGTGLPEIAKAFENGKLWAKANGINVVRTWGREGWRRSLGLKQVGVILQETIL